MRTKRITFDIPDGVLASFRWDAEHFGREVRLAAAVKGYENGMISQGRAAEV